MPLNCHGDVYLDIPSLATNWTYSDSDTARFAALCEQFTFPCKKKEKTKASKIICISSYYLFLFTYFFHVLMWLVKI